MGWLSVGALAVGLAMDATAASASRGLAAHRVRWSDALKVATLFGLFQALMPLLGWGLGIGLGPWVQRWDHWIAFAILGAIGGKMLIDARYQAPEVAKEERPFRLGLLLALAVATSLDAFAAGVSLPLLQAPLFGTLAVIALVTAGSSAGGLYAGRRFGKLLGPRCDAIGGLILVGLGTRILVEHLALGI